MTATRVQGKRWPILYIDRALDGAYRHYQAFYRRGLAATDPFARATAGVDVGATQEIHGIIRRVAQQGAAVIVVSSVIHELLTICNRVYVMRKGQIVFVSERLI